METEDATVTDDELARLRDALLELRQSVADGAKRRLGRYCEGDPLAICTPSALNLAAYLGLRSCDLRLLQSRLARCGLSSLGRVEAHVMASLGAVIGVLERLTGHESSSAPITRSPGFDEGTGLLATHTLDLFGPAPARRGVRIMVTLPPEAAEDATLVQGLMAAGMDCARINCAHDGPAAWSRMIEHLRRAEAMQGRRCCLMMDLGGHKIRTGPVMTLPGVVHIKPERDRHGVTVEPAEVLLVADEVKNIHSLDEERYRLFAPRVLLNRLVPGDRLDFVDARGKQRHFDAVEAVTDGVWRLHGAQGTWIDAGTVLHHRRQGVLGEWETVGEPVHLSAFPPEAVDIQIETGDLLRLTRDTAPGEPATFDAAGILSEPAHIPISIPEILDRLHPGQPAWIDDGKIGAVIDSVDEHGVLLRITQCRPGGARLRAGKGLNFPGADLGLGPLSGRDLEDLDFVVRHADLVGFSFVESGDDMRRLADELVRRNAGHLGIIAKIETRRAVENLPDILLSTIGRHRLGVMIARGDLAVEIGGVRLAEIQEELLWLCEAAHVPVIWATQVLETMAKTGALSRPEMTDAAMSGRAECVMLNKGPYVLDAVHTLDAILRRMQDHQCKKTAQLRALKLAG